MADEVHPVVRLMLARMETHPEEFTECAESSSPEYFSGRWGPTIMAIRKYGTKADQDAFFPTYNRLRMDAQHEDTMDELCNGEARREQAEREYMTLGNKPTRPVSPPPTLFQRVTKAMRNDRV